MKRVDIAPSAKRSRSKKVAWGSDYRLGDIATVQQGYTFSPEHQGQSVGKWLYVKVGDLSAHGNSKYLDRTFNCVDDDVVVRIGAVPFAAGSIVFPRVGAALKNNNKRILSHASLTDDNVIVVTVVNSQVCDAEYLYYWFDAQDLRRFCNDGTVPVINGTNLKRALVRLPQICTQRGTAELLSTWDAAIQRTKQLIAAKECRLDHLRNHLLRQPKRGTATNLLAVTRELTTRNGATLGREAIMAVTKHVGMRPMREETIAPNIERYKLVPPRAFAYNPMRLNIGSIAMSPFDSDVLVSPDYVVFACDESKLFSGYMNHLRDSRSWKSHFELAGNGSVRVRIYYDDLATFSFLLPPLPVQRRIVKFLDATVQEIALLYQQAEALRRQKRGLMQKLLNGDWRLPLPEQEAV